VPRRNQPLSLLKQLLMHCNGIHLSLDLTLHRTLALSTPLTCVSGAGRRIRINLQPEIRNERLDNSSFVESHFVIIKTLADSMGPSRLPTSARKSSKTLPRTPHLIRSVSTDNANATLETTHCMAIRIA